MFTARHYGTFCIDSTRYTWPGVLFGLLVLGLLWEQVGQIELELIIDKPPLFHVRPSATSAQSTAAIKTLFNTVVAMSSLTDLSTVTAFFCFSTAGLGLKPVVQQLSVFFVNLVFCLLPFESIYLAPPQHCNRLWFNVPSVSRLSFSWNASSLALLNFNSHKAKTNNTEQLVYALKNAVYIVQLLIEIRT